MLSVDEVRHVRHAHVTQSFHIDLRKASRHCETQISDGKRLCCDCPAVWPDGELDYETLMIESKKKKEYLFSQYL